MPQEVISEHNGDRSNHETSEEGTAKDITFFEASQAILLNSPMNVLLIAVFPCLVCYYGGFAEYLTFIFAVLALAPLAERLSFTTEQLCLHTNDTTAGLLNVTFGNATELIVGIMALKYGLKRLIQLSLLGSVLSNSLLVLGSSFLVSGIQFKAIRFNAHLNHVTAVQMVLAMVSVVIASVSYSSSESSKLQELGYSRGLALGMLLVYSGFVTFQLITHTEYYNVKEATGSVRWNSALSALYAGLPAGKALLIPSYQPVPSDTETGPAAAVENEEPLRHVQLESAALHPEHHHTHRHDEHFAATNPLAAHKDAGVVVADEKEAVDGPHEGEVVADEDGDGDEVTGDDEEDDDDEEDQLGFVNALIWLGIITVIIAIVSNALADTIENAADKLGISSNFLATIVLPILGNAAEHASAIIFGYKGKATLAMAIAIGSSIQIALFVFPLLIVLGWMIGLDVDFDMGNFEAITLLVASILPNLILTVARSSYTDGDNKVMLGETHYFSGVILVAAYFMIAVGFYARNEESLDT